MYVSHTKSFSNNLYETCFLTIKWGRDRRIFQREVRKIKKGFELRLIFMSGSAFIELYEYCGASYFISLVFNHDAGARRCLVTLLSFKVVKFCDLKF